MARVDTSFSGDRPLENEGGDKLGFKEPAKHIASAIIRFASPDGFVIGIEGAWGSGKSSLVNLMVKSLQSHPSSPEIVHFSPWLINSRDVLLDELFRDIGKAATAINLDEATANQQAKLEAALKGFVDPLRGLSKVAKVAELFGVPHAGIASRALESAAGAAADWSKESSLDKKKEKLKKELKKLKGKIVVVIDDLDRLEPAEAIEVVRLVRAVADFPNIVYVLCYSREILANSLKVALKLEDGATYLDKVVQVTFSVPQPEDLDLRRWYWTEIQSVFPEIFSSKSDALSGNAIQRLRTVIDLEGGRSLLTPRSVVRAINGLRLYAGPIIDQIDIGDMAWLQFIRLRNTKLFDWIEKYLNNVGAISAGARVTKREAKKIFDELKEIIALEKRDVDDVMQEFRSILPGLSYSSSGTQGASWKLFDELDKDKLVSYVIGRRLGSPQHFRLYFAFSKPKGALEDKEFRDFIALAESNPKAASIVFEKMAATKRPQGGTMADAALDRLINVGLDSVPLKAIPGLLLSLSNAMDIAARHSEEGDWGQYWIWGVATNLFKNCVSKLSGKTRKDTVHKIFADGKALGWVAGILRTETFSHGRYGSRLSPESDWIISEDEYDDAVSTIFSRFKKIPPKIILHSPHMLNLLFFWSQAGGAEDVKNWVHNITRSNTGFLEFLERTRSWSARNDVIYYPIRRENIEKFADYDALKKRLDRLKKNRDPKVRKQVEKLLIAFKEGDKD